MYYVYSTLASDQNYAVWTKTPDGLQVKTKDIFIKGGGQLPSSNGYDLVTPLGVVTRVNDDDIAELEANYTFQVHKKNGFIRIEQVREDVEKVVSNDMQLPDESQGAPLTEQHIEKLPKQKGLSVKVMEGEE